MIAVERERERELMDMNMSVDMLERRTLEDSPSKLM
jgi:hypothetical protein